MNENNLKLAQEDIEDALKTVEALESKLDCNELSKDLLKEQFVKLTDKLQKLEHILKTEGII